MGVRREAAQGEEAGSAAHDLSLRTEVYERPACPCICGRPLADAGGSSKLAAVRREAAPLNAPVVALLPVARGELITGGDFPKYRRGVKAALRAAFLARSKREARRCSSALARVRPTDRDHDDHRPSREAMAAPTRCSSQSAPLRSKPRCSKRRWCHLTHEPASWGCQAPRLSAAVGMPNILAGERMCRASTTRRDKEKLAQPCRANARPAGVRSSIEIRGSAPRCAEHREQARRPSCRCSARAGS